MGARATTPTLHSPFLAIQKHHRPFLIGEWSGPDFRVHVLDKVQVEVAPQVDPPLFVVVYAIAVARRRTRV